MSSVSVVIPCYNYGHFLREAAASVLGSQPGVDVRVLIIDDASPDGSAQVAKEIAADDPRVEVVAHAANRGAIPTYNEGIIEWADGDYTVLMSADDQLTPGALSRAAEFLDAHPNVGFVYGHPLHFQQGQPLPVARTSVQGSTVWPGQRWLAARYRDGKSVITCPEVVVRTSLQKRAGGWNPGLYHSADMEMWLRLAARADVGYLRGVDQALYRIHGKNMTTTRPHLVDLQQRKMAFDSVLERCADEIPDRAELADAVHRSLCWEALWTAARAYDRGRTEQTPVDELIAFAFECRPDASRTSLYRALRLRQRIGPRAMPYLQPFVLSAYVRKAQNMWWWRSWERRGIG
jgi:glycosyltransferase involved in cell wall biosynthesis